MKEQATYPWYLVPTILSSTASSVVQWPLATTRCAGGGEWLLALLSSSCLGDSPGGGGGRGGWADENRSGRVPGVSIWSSEEGTKGKARLSSCSCPGRLSRPEKSPSPMAPKGYLQLFLCMPCCISPLREQARCCLLARGWK